MRAGPLRHKITIQEVTETSDSMGGFTDSWATYTTAFASITPVRGVEALEHKKLEHELVHRIWIRYQSGITTKMRIVWGSRTLKIIGLRDPDERHKMIEIMAEESVT